MPKKVMYADSDHKEKLAAFMQTVNPKPTLEQIEQLKQSYIERRDMGVRVYETDSMRSEV